MTNACPRCGLARASSRLALCPACLFADDTPEPTPSDPPGLVLEAEIGRGGMGRVFRARHVRLHRVVAVKFLPQELEGDPTFQARFAREARALALFSHPNIVSVHDFGTTPDGESFLVMEFVPGGPLSSYIPMPLDEALRATAEICDALDYAHARGIVHRDLKPANVLFDDSKHVKLVDFGIARFKESALPSDRLTGKLDVLGTPGYLAPEAREGAPPDPRMDVFSAGVLLCVLLTGELPDAELTRVPSSLRAVVRRATASDPSARFPSAFDLRRALPVAHESAEPPSSLQELDRLAPEEQSWLRAVALTLTGATALSLYALLTSITPRVVAESDALPFVVFGAQKLAGGGVYTRARFETFPVLSAALSWAIALAAYGVLRGHWRTAGIERATPDRRLPYARPVLMFGIFLDAIFVGRMALERNHPTELVNYVPVLGGVLELVMVYLVWSAVLEALRTKRPLTREPVLWLGLALSLIPPAVSFGEILFSASGSPR
jgi:predicted Ser/Thr protein kinase